MRGLCDDLMLLSAVDLCDTRGLYSLYGYGAEKSGIRESGAPVPAEHAGCLADVGEAGHGVRGTAYGTLLIFFADKAGGRVQNHFQMINGICRVVHYFGGDVILPDAVHVIGASKMLSVQIDVCQCIDSLEAQEKAVSLKGFIAQGEVRLVGKVIFHQLRCSQFVIAVKRIRDQIFLEQSSVYGGGNFGLDGGLGNVIYIFTEHGQGPVVV